MTSLLLWQLLSIVMMFYSLLHKTAMYQDVLLQRDPCIALTSPFKMADGVRTHKEKCYISTQIHVARFLAVLMVVSVCTSSKSL